MKIREVGIGQHVTLDWAPGEYKVNCKGTLNGVFWLEAVDRSAEFVCIMQGRGMVEAHATSMTEVVSTSTQGEIF